MLAEERRSAPCAPPTANDNRPEGSDWPRVLALFNAHIPQLAAAAWRSKASGQSALAFVEGVLEADRILKAGAA